MIIDLSGILPSTSTLLQWAGVLAVAGLGLWLAWRFFARSIGWLGRRPPFRESPMRFRVGRPGSGKSLVSIKDAIVAMRRGVPVYSNTPIVDPVSGRRSGLVNGWAHLLSMTETRDKGGLELRNFMVLVDEGNVWACSRMSKMIPIWLLSWWAQRRHYGAEIHITAQHENRVDVVLRETVDKIDVCERVRWLPKYVPVFKLTPCYPEELEALRGGQEQKSELHPIRWWVFFGYSTAENVQPVDLKADQQPDINHETIVHPNYLPGIAWDGAPIPRQAFKVFQDLGPSRWWKEWRAYLDTPAGQRLSGPALTSEQFQGWCRSQEGQAAMEALNGWNGVPRDLEPLDADRVEQIVTESLARAVKRSADRAVGSPSPVELCTGVGVENV